MQNFTPIGQVPKDFNPLTISEVKNPFDEPFTHDFNGEPITIGVGETLEAPENVARHMAEHIVKKQIRDNHESYLEEMMKKHGEDSKAFQKMKAGAIPLYDSKIEEGVKAVMTNRSSIKKAEGNGAKIMTQSEKMQQGKQVKKLATEMATKMVAEQTKLKDAPE